MINSLVILIDSIIFGLALFYASSKILNKKLFLNKSLYILTIILYLFISYLSTDSIIRVLILFILFSLILAKTFSIDLVKGTVTAFIVLVLNLISEILYTLFIVILFNSSLEFLKENYFGTILTNISIAVILISLVIFSKKYLIKLLDKIAVQNNKLIYLFSFLSFLSITVLVYYYFFKNNFQNSLIMALLILIIYISMTLSLFFELHKKNRLEFEYQMVLKNMEEYEKLYSYQRMLNHEFNNNLMVIRGLSSKNNKKLLEYIDNISNFKSSDIADSTNILKKIPSGGLLGLLYSKILVMNNKKISFELIVSKNFKRSIYKNIPDKTKNDLCTLLGIYLDNAIESFNNSKLKNILVEINILDGFLNVSVVNNISGNVDLSNIDKKGYSTKGKNRGYGLSIAENIVKKNSDINVETYITGFNFRQLIKVKM